MWLDFLRRNIGKGEAGRGRGKGGNCWNWGHGKDKAFPAVVREAGYASGSLLNRIDRRNKIRAND